ncbi:unnamed protein product, partial [Iphiclides podalirius]
MHFKNERRFYYKRLSQSARSEGESSGEQSCDSSDEGVGRDAPVPRNQLHMKHTVRDDFESLKTSLHPHLSSLASLAQGAPLSAPSSVFALAGAGATGGFPYAPPAFLAPAPPPPAQPAGSASSSSSEGSAAGWSFEEQYKQVRQEFVTFARFRRAPRSIPFTAPYGAGHELGAFVRHALTCRTAQWNRAHTMEPRTPNAPP